MASQQGFDCSPKCSSKLHIYQLISAITKSSEHSIINFIARCHNASKSYDTFGRTLLHVAVSCGNKTVLDWLLTQAHLRISAKDLESGWTSLHRAFFYGQLDMAWHLIQNGADIGIKDREFLTPFELTLKDRPKHIEFTNTGLNEVYSQGPNANSTLGLENMQSAKIHEQVDFFRREKISINMVSMNMFHTIFLSDIGRAYVCGHGQDGRLGLGCEKTILTPTLVNTLANEKCVYISASLNQSYFLMESGLIYSCGLNTYNQLAHHQHVEKSLIPKFMNLKNLKIMKVEKIFGLRYHTIILADNNLYTWGLNSGQIGHAKLTSDAIITTPRIVTQIIKGTTLTHIAASDNGTVVGTSKGDIYVMQDYACKKVIHRFLGISQICVSGGKLDPLNDPDKGKNSSPITLVGSTSFGKMFVWNSEENHIRHIHWVQQFPIKVINFCLGSNWLVITTNEGNCLKTHLPVEFRPRPFAVCGPIKDLVADFHGKSLTNLVSEMEFLNLTLQKIPNINRANSVTCDHKGQNIIILQASPNASLNTVPLEGTSNFGEEIKELLLQSEGFVSTYDVILKFNNESFNCHKFILAQKSNYFQSLFAAREQNNETIEENISKINGDQKDEVFKLISKNNFAREYNYLTIDHQVPAYQVNVKIIPSSIFKQFLFFLYTGSCDFIMPGSSLVTYSVVKGNSLVKYNEAKSKKKRERSTTNEVKTGNVFIEAANHLKFLAKFFVATSLLKVMDKFDYSDSYVRLKSDAPCSSALSLNYIASWAKSLSDIVIETDSRSFLCHKCVLVARMEYFKGMLSCNWMGMPKETDQPTIIHLPIDAQVFENLLDYVYTDDCKKIKGSEDIEFLCKLLSAADQFLLRRMQEIIEVILAQLITLKNVCNILELSIMCNAVQLAATCMQFIAYNLAEIFEMRLLDTLSEDVLKKLTLYYRENTKGMHFRIITPFGEWPSLSDIENIEKVTTPSKTKRIKTKSETINPVLIEGNNKDPEEVNLNVSAEGYETLNLTDEYNFEPQVNNFFLPKIKEDKWTPIKPKSNKKSNSKTDDSNKKEITKVDDNFKQVKNVNTNCTVNNVNYSISVGKQDLKKNVNLWNSSNNIENDSFISNIKSDENELNIKANNSKLNSDKSISSEFTKGIPKTDSPDFNNKFDSKTIFADEFPLLETVFSNSNSQNLIKEVNNLMSDKILTKKSDNIFKPKKKESQKHRKDLQRQLNLKALTVEDDMITSENLKLDISLGNRKSMSPPDYVISNPASCVWGKNSKIVESFKDLMIEEIIDQNANIDLGCRNKIILSKQSGSAHWRQSDAKTTVSKQDLYEAKSPELKGGGDALKFPRWQGGGEDLKFSNMSLQKIIDEEMRMKEYLMRRKKTNLQHVLLEEKALEELLLHYNTSNYNEFITIERVVAMNMEPVWTVNK